MSKETLKQLGVPIFFLLVFLIPALFWDTLILQVSSDLIRRSIAIGRYVIGTCLWLTLAWFVMRCIDFVVWPVLIGLCTKNPVSTLTHRSIRPF